MFKKTLPIAFGVVVGLYAVIQYYIPHHAVDEQTTRMRDWAAILAASAYLLGAINLIQVTVPRIRRREADWQYKVVMLASTAIMLTVGLPFWGKLGSTKPGQVEVVGTDATAAALGKAVIEFAAPPEALVQVGVADPQPAVDAFGKPARVMVEPGAISFKVFREISGFSSYDTGSYATQVAASKGAETKELHAQLAEATKADHAAAAKALDARIKAIEAPPALVAGQVIRVTAEPVQLWGSKGRLFTWMYDHVFAPCNATMFALLAFFVASAAFRAFRARNVESALLLGAAIIVMLGNMPMGRWMWDALPDIKQWILDVPNNGSRRAIIMGAGVGAIATSLRVVLGLERSHLGSD